jgi:putative SOS response-associated peptidase YedK
MCGKASVHIKWKDVYAYASALKPPSALPPDPEPRVNVSPSRLRRKSEPDSMVWETLPVIHPHADEDLPTEALWPYIRLLRGTPAGKSRDKSFHVCRLRTEINRYSTFWGMECGSACCVVSWFYEFDSRVKPQVPYAVFPTNAPCWLMAGLARRTILPNGESPLTVAIITVDPNAVLKSVGHHRSPALLRSGEEARTWLTTTRKPLALLRP